MPDQPARNPNRSLSRMVMLVFGIVLALAVAYIASGGMKAGDDHPDGGYTEPVVDGRN